MASKIDIPQTADRPLAEVEDTFNPELDTTPLGDVTENDDGSATFADVEEDKGKKKSEDFYANLAESLDDEELDELSSDLLEKIALDKESRKKRDEQYEEGLRRTGLGDDAPGGAQFHGASKVVHPLLAEACIDFSARTMKEIFPPRGPVKTHILSKADDAAVDRAELKAKVLNWQLTQQMREYREEMEQLTTQEPMGGSQFLKIWHDAARGRHRVEFVPVDKLLLPYSASGLYSSERVTHVQDITRYTFDSRVNSGLYREVEINMYGDSLPEETKTQKANNKIEGLEEDAYNEDGLRQIYEVYVYHKFDDDKDPLPYIVHIDEYSEEVLAVYRNWAEEDKRCEKLDWLVEFKFIPWRGAYGIGLPHLIGGISGALTGALRALLDSAHISNAATMLKLKGIRGSGESTEVAVTQVCEIEAPPQVDDIRKVAMPMPFNPPSPVLFQLLGFLSDVGKGVVGTAEEALSEATNNTPVGTTLALIEQGSQVYSAIHSRHHFAQARVLAIICRLNKQYPETLKGAEEALKETIEPDLFNNSSDIEPISDPNIFSEAQRYAQIQAVIQLMQDPSLQGKVDTVALARIAMKRMKFDQADDILPDPPKAKKIDPVNENVLATKGISIAAFMEQDHIAHLIVHLDFCDSPLFGSNPILAAPAVPALIGHCGEHLTMFYSKHMRAAVAAFTEIHGAADMDEAKMASGIRNAVAMAEKELATQLAPVMEMMQRAQQIAMGAAPKPPLDPASQVTLQLGQAEIQRKTTLDQATIALNQSKMQAEQAMEQMKAQHTAQQAEADAARAQQQQQFEQYMANLEAQSEERNNMMIQQREHDHALLAQQTEMMKEHYGKLINDQNNQTQILIELMKEGKTPAPEVSSPDPEDTMAPLLKALQTTLDQAQQAQQQQQHGETMNTIMQGIHGILKHQAAPKVVHRDAQGNIVGVTSQLGE